MSENWFKNASLHCNEPESLNTISLFYCKLLIKGAIPHSLLFLHVFSPALWLPNPGLLKKNLNCFLQVLQLLPSDLKMFCLSSWAPSIRYGFLPPVPWGAPPCTPPHPSFRLILSLLSSALHCFLGSLPPPLTVGEFLPPHLSAACLQFYFFS